MKKEFAAPLVGLSVAVGGAVLPGASAQAAPSYSHLTSTKAKSTGTSWLGHAGYKGNNRWSLAARARNGGWSINDLCYATVGAWY
ncbi:MAG: hypothetical protein LBD77_00010 [Bifidobacteriaceae bacterium]|jgi:hypothetical protein|nr:hypothetical protein [Bifidobacteriaceae bacterium]